MYQENSQDVIKTFNIGLLVSALIIFIFGVVTLYSATKGPGVQNLYKIQLLWFFIGWALASPLIFIDSEFLSRVSYLFYGFCLILLVLVLIIGNVGGGSQRWLNLGFFTLQPSEVAKIGIVFTFAKYFSEEEIGPPYTLKRLVVPGILVAPYFILILLQPDIGTAGILFLTAASMVLFLKVHWRSLVLVFLITIIVLPVSYRFVLYLPKVIRKGVVTDRAKRKC